MSQVAQPQESPPGIHWFELLLPDWVRNVAPRSGKWRLSGYFD